MNFRDKMLGKQSFLFSFRMTAEDVDALEAGQTVRIFIKGVTFDLAIASSWNQKEVRK